MIEYIKYKLRGNSFYKKYCQTRVNDMRYFFKNMRMYFNKYRFKKDKEVEGNTLYFIFDDKQRHPGLADRLKVLACVYYVAKINGFDFKIICDRSLDLPKYLNENEVKWVGSEDELSYSLRNSRLIAYNGGGKVPKLNKKVKQYHIYYYIGLSILRSNNIPDYERVWSKHYRELFQTKDIIKEKYHLTGLEPNKYIAVHLRFVNSLEHFEDGFYNAITVDEQEKLIADCLDAIRDIQSKHSEPVVIFSDSNRFINCAKEAGYRTLEGEIGHISFNGSDDAQMKAFLDFYAISQSKKVYRIVKPHMYYTTFSMFGAMCEDKEFETIN